MTDRPVAGRCHGSHIRLSRVTVKFIRRLLWITAQSSVGLRIDDRSIGPGCSCAQVAGTVHWSPFPDRTNCLSWATLRFVTDRVDNVTLWAGWLSVVNEMSG